MPETTNIPIPLKYRPLKFSELIGQDLMSKTIQNAIEMNRIANAYLLTGVRGVGKTTTARIIAKSLGYFVNGAGKNNLTFFNVVGYY
jgi:DNA polymerase-3 subunit gamma/tau